MPTSYAPLPNPHADPQAEHELEAAFDDSDSGSEDGYEDAGGGLPQPVTAPGRGHGHGRAASSLFGRSRLRTADGYHPLAGEDPSPAADSPIDEQEQAHALSEIAAAAAGTRTGTGTGVAAAVVHAPATAPMQIPGTYNFESTDFDYARPPPGSPPEPTRAFPNEWGNSNGLVPNFEARAAAASRGAGMGSGRGAWLRRAAGSVLPAPVAERLGLGGREARGPVGGGVNNDGVFANVVAKPTRPVRIQEGDDTYLVPEDSQKDAPPSYASAQADAVPPYWETTIHAPASALAAGEVIIDALPTGSLFSFLWSALISVSFQFVGFLLTYLLHTTHAAKFGARAGLGVTLIQYGFAMRREDGEEYVGGGGSTTQEGAGWGKPYFETAAQADEYYKGLAANASASVGGDGQVTLALGDATSEWISFLLMTIGWFILLTSLLGFWRVKRYERSILSSQQLPTAATGPGGRVGGPANGALIHTLERALGLQGLADGSLLRAGFGLAPAGDAGEARQPDLDEEEHLVRVLEDMGVPRAEDGEDADGGEGGRGQDRRGSWREGEREREERLRSPRGEYILQLDPDDPERNARMAQAMAVQARLHHDLRAAGLI